MQAGDLRRPTRTQVLTFNDHMQHVFEGHPSGTRAITMPTDFLALRLDEGRSVELQAISKPVWVLMLVDRSLSWLLPWQACCVEPMC